MSRYLLGATSRQGLPLPKRLYRRGDFAGRLQAVRRVGFIYDCCVLLPVQVNNAYYVIDKYANF